MYTSSYFISFGTITINAARLLSALKKGHITAIRPTDRSYHVEFDSGKTSVRNRKFLRPINELPITTIPGQSGYNADFPRRSARLAKKRKSVTFDENPVLSYFQKMNWE